ncbi:MAG: N-acetyltransferase, partial [Maribacter sp.]|nr:N-acetyltransferase [Maribacter sp.]
MVTEVNKSKIIYGRSKTDNELYQILELQRKNLFDNISDEQQKDEGFLSVEHSFDLLKRMNMTCPHIIAKLEDKVIGYALCMHPQFSQELELLKSMFIELQSILSKNDKYIVMGQICV